jgi:hypothetical protein
MGTLTAEARFIPWKSKAYDDSTANISSDSSTKSPFDSWHNQLPKGAVASCNWKQLLASLVGVQQQSSSSSSSSSSATMNTSSSTKSLLHAVSNNLHQICCIDSDETDTQVDIWADSNTKLVRLPLPSLSLLLSSSHRISLGLIDSTLLSRNRADQVQGYFNRYQSRAGTVSMCHHNMIMACAVELISLPLLI